VWNRVWILLELRQVIEHLLGNNIIDGNADLGAASSKLGYCTPRCSKHEERENKKFLHRAIPFA
jgi:hypothetical protein